MPTRRALLIAQPELGVAAPRALALVRDSLTRHGFTDFVSLPSGARLGLEAVHQAIEALAERASLDDACCIYYFGHGGRVVFDDLEGPHAGRVFSFLSCHPGADFDALFDLPLRTRLARLARRCNNLTVILDACHSGTLVRSTAKVRAPAWLIDELARHDPSDAPPIVCIAGAPPLSEAGTNRTSGVGWLTEQLCNELDAIASRGIAVSWHALAHRLRGRVITCSGSEHQWIVASGPCERRLFESEPLADARSVGYVVAPDQTWLRVGGLQGSMVGDHWALLDLDDRELARGSVIEVDSNRSKLALEQPLAPGLPPEGHARLVRAAQPTRLVMDPALHAAAATRLARSAWLSLDADQPQAELGGGERLHVREHDARWPELALPSDALDVALELLEDRARSRRLLALPTHGAEQLHIAGVPERLREGEALTLTLTCAPSNPDPLYVVLVLIDALGRPWRLAPEHAEGIQVDRNRAQWVVVKAAARWPEGVEADSLRCTIVALAGDRPLQAEHLTRPHPGVEGLPLGLAVTSKRMRGSTHQPRAPLGTRRAAVLRQELELIRG